MKTPRSFVQMGLNELGLLKDLAQIGKSAGTDVRKCASQPALNTLKTQLVVLVMNAPA